MRTIRQLLVCGVALVATAGTVAGCTGQKKAAAPAPNFATSTLPAPSTAPSTTPGTTAAPTTTAPPTTPAPATTAAPTGATSPQQLIPEFVAAYGSTAGLTNAQLEAKLTGLVTPNFDATTSQESDANLPGTTSTATAGDFVQIDGPRWNVAVGLTTNIPGVTTTTNTVTWDLTIVDTPTGYEVDNLTVAANQANVPPQ